MHFLNGVDIMAEQPQPPFPIPMMQKNFAIQVPFDPDTVDTAFLKTMLIPLKAVHKELNEYIQKLEQVLRDRK